MIESQTQNTYCLWFISIEVVASIWMKHVSLTIYGNVYRCPHVQKDVVLMYLINVLRFIKYQVIERTRFCDGQTDRQTDRQTRGET